MAREFKTTEILKWGSKKDLTTLKKSLKNDEISITTTDTTLGFIANTSNLSFQYLCSIKHRKTDKPFIILIESFDKLSNFVDVKSLSDKVVKFIKKCWRNPVTVILDAKESLPDFLKSKNGTIAIRIPKHDGLKNLLKSFDGLFSTSANKDGGIVPTFLDDVQVDILDKVKYFVMDVGIQENLPSTIIDVSSKRIEDPFEVLREGKISKKKLREMYAKSKTVKTKKIKKRKVRSKRK